jgi:hypothetical protein
VVTVAQFVGINTLLVGGITEQATDMDTLFVSPDTRADNNEISVMAWHGSVFFYLSLIPSKAHSMQGKALGADKYLFFQGEIDPLIENYDDRFDTGHHPPFILIILFPLLYIFELTTFQYPSGRTAPLVDCSQKRTCTA